MSTQRKSYAIVMVCADGKLPVPVALAGDFGILEGDPAGLRKPTDGKWELIFWCQLHTLRAVGLRR